MKNLYLLAGLLVSSVTLAEEAWQNTTISEETIQKIQAAKLDYKKCVSEQMQKPVFAEMDTRKATDEIIKQCEPSLTKMRDIYMGDKVPGEIADRHLRQVRIQTSRKVLENMIFNQASRNVGQP